MNVEAGAVFRAARIAVLVLVVAYFLAAVRRAVVVPGLAPLPARARARGRLLRRRLAAGAARGARRRRGAGPRAAAARPVRSRELGLLGPVRADASDRRRARASAGSTSSRRSARSRCRGPPLRRRHARAAGTRSRRSARRRPRRSCPARRARSRAIPPRSRATTKGEFVGFVQDADGLAEVGGDQAFLTPEICDTLYQLAIKHRVQSFSRTARAIAVLAHESWHLRGEATRASRTATASRAASRSASEPRPLARAARGR